MGAESVFYVQTREHNYDVWTTVPLYKKDNDFVDFFFCGRDVVNHVQDMFRVMDSDIDRECFDIDAQLKDEDENTNIYDQNEYPMYEVSLSYLKAVAANFNPDRCIQPNEYDEDFDYLSKERLAYMIVGKVETILTLADMEWLHPDCVRVACFISY